jgi:hypothetical protein
MEHPASADTYFAGFALPCWTTVIGSLAARVRVDLAITCKCNQKLYIDLHVAFPKIARGGIFFRLRCSVLSELER